MAKLLYRLGRFSAEKRMPVVLTWLIIFAITATVAISGMSFADMTFNISGTESSDALTRMEQAFPGSEEDDSLTSFQLVFATDGASAITDDAHAAQIASVLDQVSQLPNIVSVTNPLTSDVPTVSPNGNVAVADITAAEIADDSDLADAMETSVEGIIDPVRASGLTVEIGGSLAPIEAGGMSTTEIIGVLVAFVVLFLTFGSLAAAGANMLMALIGVAVGALGILAASAFWDIQATTLTLSTMLGLAVGIDYSLFILARFQSELRDGKNVIEAAGIATGTAGSAVIFAGTTVIIAMAGLALVGIPFITSMGLAAAFGVFVAMVASLTLGPVLMRTLGHRALPRKERNLSPDMLRASSSIARSEKPSFFERWGSAITRKPAPFFIVALIAVGILVIPFTRMDTALSVPGGEDPDSSERAAYNLIVDNFGAGYESPLIVLVESADAATDGTAVSEQIATLDHVVAVSPAIPNANNTAAMIQVTSTSGPIDEDTSDLVHDIRGTVAKSSPAVVSVTGQTAIDIDINTMLNDALIEYLIIVSILAVVLLIVLFRSILVPLTAALGFLLSVGAGMGVMVAIFQWGWGLGILGFEESQPIMSMMPIMIVGILFGLAMDYQVFLVSRIHEAHSRGLSTKEAVIEGFSRSASVVVAAATIMAAVFFGFSLAGERMITLIAISLTVGVLVDAFVVRMILVPALLSLVGEKSWWMPRLLDRTLPRIDAEGHSLSAEPAGD